MRNNSKIQFEEITYRSWAFLWGVRQDGYRLADRSTYQLGETLMEQPSVDDEAPWLVPQGNMENRYPPLSKPTLHREFASLHEDDSFVKFATRYGLLGVKSVPVFPRAGGAVVLAEPVPRWRDESWKVGQLLAFWDLVRRGDEGGVAGRLSQIVRWRQGAKGYVGVYIEMESRYDVTRKGWQVLPSIPTKGIRVDYHLHPIPPGSGEGRPGYLCDVIADTDIHPECLALWRPGDLFGPAMHYILREVNRHLKGHVTPQAVHPKDKGGIPTLYLWPDSLFIALWVLFLNELKGEIRVRQCDNCHDWKEVNLRRDPFYCSDRCRVAAWRRRSQMHDRRKGKKGK